MSARWKGDQDCHRRPVKARSRAKDGAETIRGVQPCDRCCGRSCPTSRTSALKSSASSRRQALSYARSMIMAAPMCPASGRLAMCTPGPWLAHKASHEGITAAESIAQELGNKEVHPHRFGPPQYPRLHLLPSRRSPAVGLTEAKAKEAGYDAESRALSPSSAMAKRSRWASRKALSRPCSTPRPENCWARI